MSKTDGLTACVFCGSSRGSIDSFQKSAKKMGALLAKSNIELVYGGGNEGLMGTLASSYQEAGNKAKGVIPYFLKHILKNHNSVNHVFVEDLGERKKMMEKQSDFFIIMPGGIGTFDELFEILAMNQLGLCKKPIGLLNTKNFFDPFINLLTHLEKFGFLRTDAKEQLYIQASPEKLLAMLVN